MWLSEQTVLPGNGSVAHAEAGIVTIGGEKPAVLLNGEFRNLEIIGPAGLSWRPAVGTQVLVVETDEGERFITGALAGEDSPALEDGELLLRSGNAQLKLGHDGSIHAAGDTYLTGNVFISGRLFLNGVEIVPGGV